MSAHQATHFSSPSARDHGLNVRMLRFRSRPDREEPALLARELLAIGRHSDALELTEVALARDAGDPDLELIRAQALLAAGDARPGEEALIRAAKASPEWSAPLSALARLLASRGDEARARGIAQRARTLGADDTTVGRLVAADDSERRLDARLDRFTADDASEEPVMLARALELADRLADAERVLREALLRDADDADTLAALARIERQRGHTDEAITLYRRAHSLAPGWEIAERALLSLVGVEVPIEVMELRGPSACGDEPSVVVDANVYDEARAMDLDAELDALVGAIRPRTDPTIRFRTQRDDATSETTLVGAPAIASAYAPRTKTATTAPSMARRSTSGFPTRPIKRSATQPAAYVRVIAGDKRRHVAG